MLMNVSCQTIHHKVYRVRLALRYLCCCDKECEEKRAVRRESFIGEDKRMDRDGWKVAVQVGSQPAIPQNNVHLRQWDLAPPHPKQKSL